MSKDYPKEINYYDQRFLPSDFIALKPQFAAERKAMRLLQRQTEECKYIAQENQAAYAIVPAEEHFVSLMTGESLDQDEMNEEFNFVLTCEEKPQLLVDKKLNHSFLANGKKVLAAGSLIFSQGILIGLTNNSGHYRPTDEQMLAVIKALHSASDYHLRYYRSYVSDPAKTYAVQELLDVDTFAEVRPLGDEEILLESGQRQVISGYDNDSSQSQSGRRFGLTLTSELNEEYQTTITRHSFFKETIAENNTPPSINYSLL
ncbi:hypothetical protein DIZ81_09075 [Legionella taurinensis]|uniref:Uncharacterized protein n=1 Tax=Legionella taurinensis TaxID=70611 RepID=A0A3A5L6M8_9GAMM|nr:hypothetical protein [Legionella taurinensis]MDX1837818.1 hypothetical protein [Legionella taurinensis]PUT39679.1 hypothetical protein DB744_09085 [Legionella taurinensis]PUT43372.1 hypothetical protein DB746_06405 [Legionella taurinensis]PUT45818.1 hypothetical protein DB743_06400 [Legionella taurinensis]PUT47730.1 hypothetical protein DB745_07485 [Legionella taurinensis]